MQNNVIIANNARRTSVQAAMNHLPKSGSTRAKVYEYILRQGMRGATDQEIQYYLKIDGNTVRPSRLTLYKDGLIVDAGITRKNENGNNCTVWRAIEQGMML